MGWFCPRETLVGRGKDVVTGMNRNSFGWAHSYRNVFNRLKCVGKRGRGKRGNVFNRLFKKHYLKTSCVIYKISYTYYKGEKGGRGRGRGIYLQSYDSFYSCTIRIFLFRSCLTHFLARTPHNYFSWLTTQLLTNTVFLLQLVYCRRFSLFWFK